ncbi:MAG: CehA/McbA family metallohydrolase [Planctomycetales bacterium]
MNPKLFHCRGAVFRAACVACLLSAASATIAGAESPLVVAVEGQPLAANVRRVVQALELIGTPLPAELAAELEQAALQRDHRRLQQLLDPRALFVVAINPESRVKVSRGPAPARLQQAGYTPILIKIINESTVTKKLLIVSPQGGPPYAGEARFTLQRQQQTGLSSERSPKETTASAERFLHLEMFSAPPLTEILSGLEVEYALALVYSSESGKREATIGFDVGQGNQELGFRGEVPVLFQIEPAVKIELEIIDSDGSPTVGRLVFRDRAGQVYPPQARRLAPDLFFQPHVYRQSGQSVWLPPGEFVLHASRGPEYAVVTQPVSIPRAAETRVQVSLARWIDPARRGFYSGDHHIHAAGCAHYTSPTEGVRPEDMFLQVKGEGLNVGCVLTWGPCFRFQRQFFEPRPLGLSEPLTLLKYDLEISGFGSQALGHVCLLNLRDQTYPGSDGLETQGWPTWTTPVMRWCKQQGGVAGYAHSASGLQIDPVAAAGRWLARHDASKDGLLSREEAAQGLLPEPFEKIDRDRDGFLALDELRESHHRAADQLPNLAIPEMNGVGAMEVCVSTAEGVCDFISAMDTARIQEWNTWYHVMNCGFPLKVSGETDFPCMSSRHVGQGRVYVQLGQVEQVDFDAWCQGLAQGRSYVSDGYAHPLSFRVHGAAPGDPAVELASPGEVKVTAEVACARETPKAVAHGGIIPPSGRRHVGDTVELHGSRYDEMVVGGVRLVELVVNGQVVASQEIPADGQPHELVWPVMVQQSSWIALRHFPQFHTNPVIVTVADRPIRASQASARWCIEMTELLWKNREKSISEPERDAARETFARVLKQYRRIEEECAR